MVDRNPGWLWFEEPDLTTGNGDPSETEKSFARVFAGPDGDTVLSHLRKMTVGRVLGPLAGDGELRHLEGQRYLYARIHALAARGRGEKVEGSE